MPVIEEPSSRCSALLDAGRRSDSPRAGRLDACSAWKAAPSAPNRRSERPSVRALHPSASSLALDSRRSRRRSRRGTACRTESLVALPHDLPRRPFAFTTASSPLSGLWQPIVGSRAPAGRGPRRRWPSTPRPRWGDRSAGLALTALGRGHLVQVAGLNGQPSRSSVELRDGHGSARPGGRTEPRGRRRPRPAAPRWGAAHQLRGCTLACRLADAARKRRHQRTG